MATVSINVINRQLTSIDRGIKEAFNDASDYPIVAAYLAQTLTLVGIKEGYRFYEDDRGRNGTLLTLTQDVNPDFEAREFQEDKSKITDYRKASLIFGTSQALHDRHYSFLPTGSFQTNNNYAYGALEATGLKDVSFALNGSSSGYNPSFADSDTSESMKTHLASLCGDATIDGQYPYRYVTNGSPRSIYNMASDFELEEGPTGKFKEPARTKLQEQNYNPVGGVRYSGTGKNGFAAAVSTVEGFKG